MAVKRSPLLIVFLGIPGSGKTTFARQLASRIGAIYINSRSVRLAIMGSASAVERRMGTAQERADFDKEVFRVMDYMCEESLRTGIDVVCDRNANTREDRLQRGKLAVDSGGIALTVMINTPIDTAVDRAASRLTSREETQFSKEKAREVVEEFVAASEPPGSDENVIEISGEVSFDEQYEVFRRGVERIYEQAG